MSTDSRISDDSSIGKDSLASSGYEGPSTVSRASFRTTTLVSEFNGRIECLTHYSSRVIIGSNDGRLVMYDTRKSHGGSTPGATYKFPHGCAIEQLLAVPHVRILLVISDGELTAHSATDLQPLDFDFSRVNMHKVRLMCLNQRGPPHFRVGVAQLKRKAIVIYQYHATDKSYKYLREFNIQDIPEAMGWYRNKIVVGLRKDYHLVDDKSGESKPINAAGIENPQVFPTVKLLPNEDVLISVMDRVGVFVDLKGEPRNKNSITWSQSPSNVEYTQPYVVGLVPRVGVEIHSMQDQSLVQNIPLPRACCMFGNGMKYNMEPRPFGDTEDVIIVGIRDSAKNSSVVKVEQTPMDEQIAELLDAGQIDEAQTIVRKSITSMPTEKQRSKMKRFQRQATVALLRRLEFDSAGDHMYKSAMDPNEFIAFFPDYQCDSFAFEPNVLKPEVLPRGGSVAPDIRSVIHEILTTRTTALSTEVARLDEDALYNSSKKALMRFLTQHRRHMKDKEQRSRNRTSSRTRDSSTPGQGGASAREARRNEAVDTALFRLYVDFKRQKELIALVEDSLSDLENPTLDYEECKELLKKNRLYYELGQLLLMQGLVQDAMDVYAAMHSGEYRQANVPRTAVEAAIDVLIAAPATMEEFVFEQAEWILKATQPKQALRIFTDRKPPLQPNAVAAFLRQHSDDPTIVQRYLETLVKSDRDNVKEENAAPPAAVNDSYSTFLQGEGNDEELVPEPVSSVDPHHTTLAMEYLDEVLKLVESGETPSKSNPGKETGGLGDARKRLIRFLRDNDSRYDVGPLFEKVKGTHLYNEFVILCGRGGFHTDAVQTMVHELNDLRGAEGYAAKYGARTSSSGEKATSGDNEALLALVKLLFHATDESKKASFLDFAYQLLAKYGKEMDGRKVLQALPPSTPVSKLSEYFTMLLPFSAHNVREAHLKKSLSNVYNLQVQCQRVDRLSRNVEIDPNTVCTFCKKRIGDIVFAAYPDGKVVHYNCTNGKLDVDPVTGEKFA